jgi:hypothetical protein
MPCDVWYGDATTLPGYVPPAPPSPSPDVAALQAQVAALEAKIAKAQADLA